jgi:hypothetical protein
MIRVLENEFYYLDNFQRVLDWIAERYADLLVDEEQAFIAAFPSLPRPARALFVRLVMRKGVLFRASKLNYAEIGCPVEAAPCLLPSGWIEHDPVLTPSTNCSTCWPSPSWSRPSASAGALKNARKAEQLEALLLDAAHADAARFLALGRPWNDLALRLLVPAPVRPPAPAFLRQPAARTGPNSCCPTWACSATRKSNSRRPRAVSAPGATSSTTCACTPARSATTPAKRPPILPDVLAASPAGGFDNPWLDSRRERLLFQLGQLFEKEKDWDQAYATYAGCRYPARADGRSGCWKSTSRFAPRLRAVRRAQAAPESDAERQHLLRLGPRLARKLGHPGSRTRRRPPAVRLDLELPFPLEEKRVEGVVLRTPVARRGARVLRREQPGQHPVRPAVLARPVRRHPRRLLPSLPPRPADLYNADFYQRRRAEFAPAWPSSTRRPPRRHPRHLRRKARPAIALRDPGTGSDARSSNWRWTASRPRT